MVKPSCHTCVYAFWNRALWMRSLSSGIPARPVCANHPDTPGLMRELPPGGVCRNYRVRPPAPNLKDATIKQIPLTGGLYAYVDAADYEWLSQYRWRLSSTGYVVRREKGKLIFMHRQIMQPPKGMPVDHRDGSRLNNCRSNLHICTFQENAQNRTKRLGCASRFKGVHRAPDRPKWTAGHQFRGERIWLGYFDDEIEAARAYDYRAVECSGEFAWVNLPDEWPPERRRKVHASWKRKMARQKARAAKMKGKRTPARAKASARKGYKRPARALKRTTAQSSRGPRRRKPAARRH